MSQNRQPHILSAASNLLGICFVLITGLKISGVNESTLLDEVAMVSALGFVGACLYLLRLHAAAAHGGEL